MFEQLDKIEHSSVELVKARSLLVKIVEDYTDDPAADVDSTNKMYILLDMLTNIGNEIIDGFEALHKICKKSNPVGERSAQS